MRKLMRGLGWTIGILVVVLFVMRITAFDVMTMPDDAYLVSAAPTLWPGDTVVMLRRGKPGFGDLVRCTDPQDPRAWVIGRIVGVEGDDVEVEGHRLTVNGRSYAGETACAKAKMFVKHPETRRDVELSCDVVPMGGGWHLRLAALGQHVEQKQSKHVGPGKVFLLSDNSAMHDDSRDFGLVDATTCVDRPVFRLWGSGGWSDEQGRVSYVH